MECNDYDNDGSHDLIGSFETTVEELMKGGNKQVGIVSCLLNEQLNIVNT